MINEIRAWIARENTGGEIFYWATPSHSEIDLIYRSASTNQVVGIEFKSSKKWKSEYSRTLKERLADKTILQAFGVYLGESALNDGSVNVLPWQEFLNALWAGKVLK